MFTTLYCHFKTVMCGFQHNILYIQGIVIILGVGVFSVGCGETYQNYYLYTLQIGVCTGPS